MLRIRASFVYIVHMPNQAPISAADAAAQHGIPKRTILAAIKRGAIPAHKLGGELGVYVINPDDAARFAAAWRERHQASA